MQPFLDDRVQHRVQQRHIRAGPELQVEGRVAAQSLPARVRDDQLRAALRGILEIGGRDGMVLAGLRADHDNAVSAIRRS